ncbi:hypothetical protein LR48_Vigan04g098500 [Vigna angularis]|uniref:Uncharacterized protein n=1 Tax=Phaseolus angularis TaxID=3914 RepID=A0A0L9UE08_PHAAN|nr:hypothetical protein LR48_Vigan04g098500 [Vigna angularis]
MKEDIRKEMTQEITKKVRAELYDEVAEMVARQFQQRYEDYGNRPPPSPVAEHAVPRTGQEGSPRPKKTHLSEDDPLGALYELVKIISDAPMNVHWDSTTFGREAHIPLYLHHQDVRELASGREEINIILIQLWMMYMFDVSNKKGFNDVHGFIDPSMTHKRNKFDDIQTYITTCFGMGKEIYCFPYIHGSLATHMMLFGRSTATAKKLAWVALKDGDLILGGGAGWNKGSSHHLGRINVFYGLKNVVHCNGESKWCRVLKCAHRRARTLDSGRDGNSFFMEEAHATRGGSGDSFESTVIGF